MTVMDDQPAPERATVVTGRVRCVGSKKAYGLDFAWSLRVLLGDDVGGTTAELREFARRARAAGADTMPDVIPRVGRSNASRLSPMVLVLTPLPGKLVIRQQNESAFFDTSRAGWHAGRGVDTLMVSGCTTSGCVRPTMVDICSRNPRAALARDRALGPQEENLFDMGQKLTDLMSLEDAKAAVSRNAA